MNTTQDVSQAKVPITTKYRPIPFALISLAIVLFLYQIVGGGLTYLIFGGGMGIDQPMKYRFIAMGAEILLILVPTILLASIQTKNWKASLRLKAPDRTDVFLAVVGVIALEQLLEVYIYLQSLIPFPKTVTDLLQYYQQSVDEIYRVLISSNTILDFVVVLLVAAITPAVCEEILFRGLVLSNFELRSKRWGAIVWTGLIFGAYHMDPTTFVAISVLGMYLSYLVAKTGSIIVPMAAHFTNNLVTVILYNFTGNDAPLPSVGNSIYGTAGLILWSIFMGIVFWYTVRRVDLRVRTTIQEVSIG